MSKPEACPPANSDSGAQTRRLTVAGRVQGVGFRPFVYCLAQTHGIHGWVQNRTGRVLIVAHGEPARLSAFTRDVIERAPPLARPRLVDDQADDTEQFTGFDIRASDANAEPEIHVPPDYFLCDDCLAELNDPGDRRYRYPFINCTQCGPRYTLIRSLPYDRANTGMASFPLCPACQQEYRDPADRRFHAEPLACPDCGPRLRWQKNERVINGNEAGLAACIESLRAGGIVAVQGIGGYHLLCDAAHTGAIERLRRLKPRPHKPLAVLFPVQGTDGLEAVRRVCAIDDTQAALLRDPMRPIVLAPRRADCSLPSTLAPGLDELGVLLPYSPLHHLLARDFGGPLVATSGNVSGEPVLTEAGEAHERLARVADAFLDHDRPILRPADDSVWRVNAGRPRPLRLGRGCAPLERRLPFTLPQPLLAVGGHMKNTVALAWDDRVVISPHIGDLESPRSRAVFNQVIRDLESLYKVSSQVIACDAHSGYGSSQWAQDSGLAMVPVWHHHAHASALAGEFQGEDQWLVFTWDGVGLGPDGTLWGGEALAGGPGRWRRVTGLRPFALPGGERAGREPWRSAAALCWEAGAEFSPPHADGHVLHEAWRRRLNCPQTTAVGRLFDGAAALTGLIRDASFEGQGPMYLEAAARGDADCIELPLTADDHGILRCDWAPLLPMLTDTSRSAGERAGCFHRSLAQALVDQACALRTELGTFTVGLTGGVFQNRLLTGLALDGLQAAGFAVRLAEQIPCNDAGLSFGQIIEAAHLKSESP